MHPRAMLPNSSNNSSRSRARRRCSRSNMHHPARSGASDRARTFHSPRPARNPPEERTRHPTIAFSQAHSIPRWAPCNKARCNMRKTCSQRKHRGSRRNTSRSIREGCCTACNSHRHHRRPRPRTSRNTDKDQIRLPRHWQPNSGCHRPHNTTLQGNRAQRARWLQNSPRNLWLLNINRTFPTRNLVLPLLRCTPAR